MHLVGFTIEIYYDARSYERQILTNSLQCIVYYTPQVKHCILEYLNSQLA